ncbi:YheC/YheD family protein [Paenibacillus xylaniclasticus]|uniref:YheC/YheD family protein n=1 Tax=Paenibacillus xylaniclasticus TaxID=588083 RepID=UPI000FDC574E|nr:MULTISPECIES: YheC/YheD family protein [Paenibacillus]GFN33681.1 hypothetical protein PCURB6_39410 [Paenibacillus curdlanolyticus]
MTARASGRKVPFINKVKVSQWMRGSKTISSTIPETVGLTRTELSRMLGRYRMVYVKPSNGQKGQGVMRVRKLGDMYEFRYKRMSNRTATVVGLYKLIQRYRIGRRYLVQQGIHLMTYKGRSFDLRLMAQRKSTSGPWVITGKFARVAAKGKIVTNAAQGADVYLVQPVLRANLSESKVRSMIEQVERLVLRIAQRYAVLIPSCVELGIDIAIDRNHRIWMLELNTKPGIYPFRYFKDKSMYRKILAYRRAQ